MGVGTAGFTAGVGHCTLSHQWGSAAAGASTSISAAPSYVLLMDLHYRESICLKLCPQS